MVLGYVLLYGIGDPKLPLAEGKGFEPLDRVNGRRFSIPTRNSGGMLARLTLMLD